MSEDLSNETEAINSIYGLDTMRKLSDEDVILLSIPNYAVTIRLLFPKSYPESAPQAVGIESIGSNRPKGYGAHVLDIVRSLLQEVFEPGIVCIFALLEELQSRLDTPTDESENANQTKEVNSPSEAHLETSSNIQQPQPSFRDPPVWYLSTPITEKKSTFLARAAQVHSPTAAREAINHLLSTDKKAERATHNIMAYRIRDPTNSAVIYEDCDDDGETAAGGRLLHLLQVMDVWDCLVVVSRWYGGVKLGPDRFRIVGLVAREAVTEGPWERRRKEGRGGG